MFFSSNVKADHSILLRTFLFPLIPTLLFGIGFLVFRNFYPLDHKPGVYENTTNILFVISIYLISAGFIFLTQLLFRIYSSIETFNLRLAKVTEISEQKFSNLILEAHVNEITNHLDKKSDNSLVKRALQDVLNHNIFQLDIDRKGNFKVSGQKAALNAYYLLWRRIVEIQKRMYEDDEISMDKYLIARVTHSNNPLIWDPSENNEAEDLLHTQKEFIKYGGTIVRFFVISPNTPNQEKVNEIVALHNNKYKIPTFRVDVEREFLSFDYQYFKDQKIISKWYTTPTGEELTWMEIIDDISIVDPTHESWRKLWRLCNDEGNGDSLDKLIPKDRRY